jgi:hypothetical protein
MSEGFLSVEIGEWLLYVVALDHSHHRAHHHRSSSPNPIGCDRAKTQASFVWPPGTGLMPRVRAEKSPGAAPTQRETSACRACMNMAVGFAPILACYLPRLLKLHLQYSRGRFRYAVLHYRHPQRWKRGGHEYACTCACQSSSPRLAPPLADSSVAYAAPAPALLPPWFSPRLPSPLSAFTPSFSIDTACLLNLHLLPSTFPSRHQPSHSHHLRSTQFRHLQRVKKENHGFLSASAFSFLCSPFSSPIAVSTHS